MSEDKLTKVVKILKELEEKYKKVVKDKTNFIDFIKFIFPSEYHQKLNLDVSAGLIDLSNLQENYKIYNAAILTEQNQKIMSKYESDIVLLKNSFKNEKDELLKKLNDNENSWKLKNFELNEKIKFLENQTKNKDSDKINIDANALLLKMKKSNSGTQNNSIENKIKIEELQLKISEQNETILKLRSDLNHTQTLLLKQQASACILKINVECQTIENSNKNQANISEESYVKLKNEYEHLQEYLIVFFLF